jgi:carbon monoxide dehydrogenase subunit G
MPEWEFEHAVATKASPADAWSFWTDMNNHVRFEPGVKRIELDGPFQTGTTGRTIAETFTQEFELWDVFEEQRFTLIGYTPDRTGSLSFTWIFEPTGEGTRMRQRIHARGPGLAEHMDELRQMEVGAPQGMARLAATLDRLASSGGREG